MLKRCINISGAPEYIINRLNDAVLRISLSASGENCAMYTDDEGTVVALRVYEINTLSHVNALSLSVLLHGRDNRYDITLVASQVGGTSFFKLDLRDENDFLDKILSSLEDLI